MSPLPCSPVSNSTASDLSTQPSEEDSDNSLITPRPGPADPSQRTIANLSRPSIPVVFPAHLPGSPDAPRLALTPTGATGSQREGSIIGQGEGEVRHPYTYGTSPGRNTARQTPLDIRPPAGKDSIESSASVERRRNISFTPEAGPDKVTRQNSLRTINRRVSIGSTSHQGRTTMGDEVESSADEGTAIFKRPQRGPVNSNTYGSIDGDGVDPHGHAGGYDGAVEEPNLEWRKRRRSGSRNRGESGTIAPDRSARAASATTSNRIEGTEHVEHEGWFRNLVEKYGSVELENKGSVARDHLALERTFLAWLRTSLSFASIGIAVTQLFRLNTSISKNQEAAFSIMHASIPDMSRLRNVGKPLGATFLATAIIVLLLGFHRYFESQHYVIRGKFPASRATIVLLSLLTGALIVASLVVGVAVAPTALET